MTRTIPELLLERYRLDELPDAARAAIAREAAADPELQARLDALDRSDAAIREQYAPSVLVPRVRRRATRRVMMLAGALSTAVLALIVAIPRLTVQPDDTRIKEGGPSLAVYRRTSAGSERLIDGDVTRPGDLLRIGYASGGREYGIILSIDGAGAVTLHLPPSGDRAVHLEPGGIRLLDSSYELDAAPRIERFYFVTGKRPFEVAPVLAAARHAGGAPNALPLPAGLEQVTFAVQKAVQKEVRK
jgi:hypothetical protein